MLVEKRHHAFFLATCIGHLGCYSFIGKEKGVGWDHILISDLETHVSMDFGHCSTDKDLGELTRLTSQERQAAR